MQNFDNYQLKSFEIKQGQFYIWVALVFLVIKLNYNLIGFSII